MKPCLISSPSTMSWMRFNTGIAPRIRTLHLDIKTLFSSEGTNHRPRELLQEVFSTASTSISMPYLRNLHVTFDDDVVHLEIIRHLSSLAIENLSIEPHASRFDVNDTSSTRERVFSLGAILDLLSVQMPNLRSLRLLLPDAQGLAFAWPRFVAMLTRLEHLHTVILPTFALSKALLSAVSGHLSLANIYAYPNDPDPIWRDAYTDAADILPPLYDGAEEMTVLRLPVAPHTLPIFLPNLSHLTLAVHLRHLSELLCRAVTLPSLQSLHVIPPQSLRTTHELRNFFEVVAAKFPDLRALTVRPLVMTNAEMRVAYTTMKALRDLRKLQHLTLKTSTPFALDAAGFEDLAASWPALRTLVLDDTTALPPATAYLPLAEAVAALRRFCPAVTCVSLLVHPTVPSTPMQPWPVLRELQLRLVPPFAASPETTAALLADLCVEGARLRVDALPCDQWAILTEICADLGADGEVHGGEAHSRRFAQSCIREWKRLVTARGGEVWCEWSELLRMGMFVFRLARTVGLANPTEPK